MSVEFDMKVSFVSFSGYTRNGGLTGFSHAFPNCVLTRNFTVPAPSSPIRTR